MADFQRIDCDYTAQLVECAFFRKGGEVPHTVITTGFLDRNIWIVPQKKNINAEELFVVMLESRGIRSYDQIATHPEALKQLALRGSFEFNANFPCDFPPGQIQFREGKEVKAVDRVIAKLNLRLSQKKQ